MVLNFFWNLVYNMLRKAKAQAIPVEQGQEYKLEGLDVARQSLEVDVEV